jgi:hypothetical protein
MASHVVILHSSARRITIKTLPGTYLSEVLEQACTKLGLDASQYGLRYDDLLLQYNEFQVTREALAGTLVITDVVGCIETTKNP